jgi:hypothetical protein
MTLPGIPSADEPAATDGGKRKRRPRIVNPSAPKRATITSSASSSSAEVETSTDSAEDDAATLGGRGLANDSAEEAATSANDAQHAATTPQRPNALAGAATSRSGEDSAEDAATPRGSDEDSAEDAATPHSAVPKARPREDSAEDAATTVAVGDDAEEFEDSADDPATMEDPEDSADTAATDERVYPEASAEDAATVNAATSHAEVVELNGQRLRRVSPRQMALEKRRNERPPPPPPSPPRRETVIEELPVNNGHGDVPDEDAHEARREGMTISEIEPSDGEAFPDTAGRGPPRTLADVCALYPIGNGLHHVRVERIKPEVYGNVPCAGFMGNLVKPMSEYDFRLFYGGGRYELVVYGPDPRGRHDPVTDQPIIKALTKPIYLRIPGSPTQETLVGAPDPGKRTGMFPSPFGNERHRPPPTSADASIHRDALGLAQTLIREERAEKKELQRELHSGGGRNDVGPVVDAVRDASKEGMGVLRDELKRTRESYDNELIRRDAELRDLRRELDASRQKPSETAGAWQALSQMAGAIAPGKSSSEELSRIHDSHRAEVSRLEDQHRRELADTRAAFDERAKILQGQIDTERTRARDEVRDVTDRLERREKDAREMHEQRIKDARESYEARERDAEARHRGEVDRLRGEHERELRSQASQHELVRTTEKQSQEGRSLQLKDRIEILKEEVDRWKAEAEKNGDWAEQMAEFERKAEAAGYQKVDANAPQTWQDRIAQAFGDALRNADKITGNIASALRDRKDTAVAQATMVQAHQQATARGAGPQQQALPPGPPGQPQQQQAPQQRVIRGPGGRPVQATRSVWASEEMPMGPPPGAQGVPVMHPDSRAAPAEVTPVTVTQPVQEAAPPMQAAPPPPPPPPVHAQPQPAQGQPLALDPAAMEQFRLWAESEINNKRDPVEFAKALIERVGVQDAASIVLRLKVDTLFEAISSTPELHASAILRRDGQQFMRKAWAEAGAICRKALGIAEPEEG